MRHQDCGSKAIELLKNPYGSASSFHYWYNNTKIADENTPAFHYWYIVIAESPTTGNIITATSGSNLNWHCAVSGIPFDLDYVKKLIKSKK